MIVPYFKSWGRWVIFPGMNLHARHRYERLPDFFGEARCGEVRRVLDAGCGNGMLTYSSYLKGNRVIGISIKREEVATCQQLFNGFHKIPTSDLEIRCGNLYEADFPEESFDEIICTEVLEHIRRDEEVCRRFWHWLKRGGVLHACSPNADHPYNKTFPLDPEEQGGHVRPGYTQSSYRALLEPIGFRIDRFVGIGGALRQAINRRIKEAQEHWGVYAGLPLFAVALPLLRFESSHSEEKLPFSIYVRAVKAP
jgi:SAM-dependent methyltransferase